MSRCITGDVGAVVAVFDGRCASLMSRVGSRFGAFVTVGHGRGSEPAVTAVTEYNKVTR